MSVAASRGLLIWMGAPFAAMLIVLAAWKMARPDLTQRVYRIGYNENPPFQMRVPGGPPTGFAVEIVSAAAHRAGIKLEWVFDESPFADKLRTGEVDLWPLYTDLPERRAFAHISDPWVISDYFLLVRGAQARLPAADFAGEIFFSGPGVVRTMIASQWPGAQQRQVQKPSMLPGAFCSGESPRIFASAHQATVIFRELSRLCPDVAVQAHHIAGLPVRLGVASRHQFAPVADRLREEILWMGENGQLGEINARYAYVGLTETRMLLQLVAVERQSRFLAWTLAGLGMTFPVMAWLIWWLRRERRAADSASVAKSEFLANMSHEIRTPLGGVLGMVELALDTPPPGHREYLEAAHASAKTLLSILNDILDFSKIEARRMDLSITNVDTHSLIASSAGLMAPVANAKGLRFGVEVSPDVPRFVSTDAMRVQQILLNLTGNAIKFTEAGSVQVRLHSEPAPRGSKLVFAVSDTGIGVPAHMLNRIFRPFEQADGSVSRRFGGTGLGLAISKQLAGMMEGRIWVESVEGKGSTFSFSVLAGQASGPTQPTAEAAPHVENRPLRILLAEDNVVNQKLISTLLERDGHQVTLAASGREAVVALESGGHFDIVLMDIQMPEMDGFQATAAIRQSSDVTIRTIPIVALTAHAQVGYREVCLKAGMNGYLTKPVSRASVRVELAAHSRLPVTLEHA